MKTLTTTFYSHHYLGTKILVTAKKQKMPLLPPAKQ